LKTKYLGKNYDGVRVHTHLKTKREYRRFVKLLRRIRREIRSQDVDFNKWWGDLRR
jgi:hypothetical protein